jgi:AmiR/NasT family two-component response regulator
MTKPTILIADDERLILATLGMGLRDAGYDVIEASSGEEAIEMCERYTPDLAILDVNMPPGISGITAAREIRDRTTVPVMFLSAYDNDKYVQQAVAEGALGYLVKPVDVTKIKPSIEAARVRSRELKNLRDAELNLNIALRSGRERSVAIGMIMERYKLSEQEAFEGLRSLARRQRRKLDDVVREVIEAAGTIRDMANNRESD